MTTTCPVCEDRFDGPASLREHTWEAHGACHYCGDRFDDERRLHSHWLSAHVTELSRVDRKQAESTVGSLSFSDRFVHQGPKAAIGGLSRRVILLAAAAGIAGGAAVVAGVFDGTTGTNGPATNGNDETTVSGIVPHAPIPSSPEQYRYATMGADDVALTITYFGSWKCPYCADFSTGFLPTLVTDYVEPGKVAIKYRNLSYVGGDPFLGPDAPAAGRAGLAVWHSDPDTYWSFHEVVFRNQPPESQQWATADRLASFAKQAGVADPGVVRRAVTDGQYEDALRATTTAANQNGVGGTPTLVIDGTAVSAFDRERTRQLLENAIS